MGVIRGILSNGIANIFQKIIRVLDQLFLVPFFLKSWGAEYYGEWLTLTIIPSLLALSDLGFGSAVSNEFVLAYTSGNKKKTADLYKTGFITTTLTILFGLILTFIFLYVGNLFGLFNKSTIDAKSAIIAVSMMMAAKLLSFYNQLVEGFFRAARKAAQGTFISSIQYFTNICVGMIILLLGYKIIAFALSQLIISIIFTVIYWHLGKKSILISGEKGRFQKQLFIDIESKGIAYLSTPLWQSVYFQGSTFIVRIVLGAESVTLFNTIRTLCRSINQVYNIINASIFPELQYNYGKGEIQVAQKIYKTGIIISISAGIIGTFFLFLFGLDIYNWWTGNMLTIPLNVWYIFIIGILFNAVWWTAGVTYRMTNKPYHFAIIATSLSICSVSISYILSLYCGLTGIAIGATLFDILMAIYILPDSCKLLGIKYVEIFTYIPHCLTFIKNKVVK